MYTDPIADLLIRIKNAGKARKTSLSLPHSKVKEQILKVLKERNFISDYKVETDKHKNLYVDLNEAHAQLNVKRVSKPGQRIYVKTSEIKKINGGLGLAVISTPKGIMSGESATKNKLGGEYICQVF